MPSPPSLERLGRHWTQACLGGALALAGLGAGCDAPPADSAFAAPRPGEISDGFGDSGRRALPPLQIAATPPPPIGASTLLIDGDRAVISDSDRHRVVIADLQRDVVTATLAVDGAPGRIALHDGRAFVVLRDVGRVAVIDLDAGRVDAEWPVCPAPRGIDAAPDGMLTVACLGGRLMQLGRDGAVRGERRLQPDLRDVIVDRVDGSLWVSRFREASVTHLDDLGAAPTVMLPAGAEGSAFAFDGSAQVTSAWRMRARQAGGVAMIHVVATDSEVDTGSPGGYGSGCGPSIATTGLTVFDDSGPIDQIFMPSAVLAVDLVGGRQGSFAYSVAAPGNRTVRSTAISEVARGAIDCVGSGFPDPVDDGGGALQFVAVDVDGSWAPWFFSREPAVLAGPEGRRIDLGGPSAFDSGHDLFHVDGGGGIACATCHPEGGEDGHTWTFSDSGPRRTQELRGGIKGSEPFHWSGDLSDFGVLAGEVFARRMGGPMVTRPLAEAWIDWIDAMPLPDADLGADPVAAERGRMIYEAVGCAACHAGVRLADDESHDVGTGAALQTPSLRGIALRGPYMHDGCAPTLTDRFSDCGGQGHGEVDGLDATALADLVEYLHTL